ncbi:MAG: hypothetical protein LBE81_07940 [Azonexus sp.]|jgi:hypothetical protein|uniref:hypothetical protein n=1 Tax=Azonexus sp. TaxID=1872668 RepID=UPI00281C3023|nr:hypothetical protein [Azonexus sp.]MDR0776553.1 hypothetical protein [Azonexus sp.]
MILEYDRRSNLDRRESDVGASRDRDERRRMPERRAPVVEEVEFDDVIEVMPVSDLRRQTPIDPGETGRERDSIY